MIRRTIVLTKFLKKKTIVFVAHEFGLFPGHGGIASYLYNICKYLLENTHHNIVVIAAEYDKNTDLSKYKNFTLYSISDANLAEKRDRVLKILISVKPDYVEFAEYLALGLHCVLDKTNGKNYVRAASLYSRIFTDAEKLDNVLVIKKEDILKTLFLLPITIPLPKNAMNGMRKNR